MLELTYPIDDVVIADEIGEILWIAADVTGLVLEVDYKYCKGTRNDPNDEPYVDITEVRVIAVLIGREKVYIQPYQGESIAEYVDRNTLIDACLDDYQAKDEEARLESSILLAQDRRDYERY